MRDTAYMAWVRTLPCFCLGWGGCAGPVEADHAGVRPLGRKADDRTCIPLCRYHHRSRTDMSGVFSEATKAAMRAWLDDAIASTQALWASRTDNTPQRTTDPC